MTAAPRTGSRANQGERPPSGATSAVLTELADALAQVRMGNFGVRMPRRGGLAGEVVERFNEVVALQERRNRDLLRISRVVGREGRTLERLDEEAFDGAWAEGAQAVNSLIDDLARPTGEIARVIVAVAEGDLSQHMALEIENRPLRGEFLRIGRTVNTMVDQLSSFADEVTRVSREVGTEGKLGGQADVRGVAGTWRALTDSVNTMASNLTSQVRSIASVSTAIAEGNLSRRITVTARGEVAELAETINSLTDTLRVFADEVTRVAREVGTEGKLGAQAQVKGVSGTWRDLTESVNQLASTLTTQLRAIAGVSTSVASGDLTQRITVQARGEVADLKDNINQMILTLRETTAENAEQGWLDSNLARIGGLLQGQRDLTEVCNMIMTEVAPLVNAQVGAFFLRPIIDGAGPAEWRLSGSYGLVGAGPQVTFLPGEGLVGQAGADKQVILLTEVPSGYLPIRSGVGGAAPAAVVILPVLFEGESLGVMEFGAISSFSELHLTFLERLVVTIAVAIKTIQANRRTEQLLAESQRLAREMQDQSAELQRTNAELEDKAELLSEQNRKIEIKNLEIETARRGLEEKAQQLALASQYKSEFLANMSHELRTPLNSLLLLSRMLADNPDRNLNPKQIEFASTIHSAGSDLLALIDDILDLSKIEAGRVDVEAGPLTLDDVRRYVEQAFGPQAEEKGLELRVRIQGGGADEIVTDAQRLQQILRNLLSNAVKFTDTGSVTLAIEPAPPGMVFDLPSLDTSNQVTAFAVQDTGIGISDSKFAMIFEAFQQADGTTSRKYGGTGLGLSISRELARMLGGAITVTSTVAEGSTFTLYLPEGPPPEGPAPPPSRPSELRSDELWSNELRNNELRNNGPRSSDWRPASRHGVTPILRPPAAGRRSSPDRRRLEGRTVLIVDDDVRNVFALTSALELHGLGVLYADNGAEGLRMLAEHPEVDVVLMDAMMPDLDGNQTTRLIRELPGGTTLPVVFLTAKAMPGDRESSFAAGATDYITKPVDLDELLEAMSDWVGRYRGRSTGGE